MIGATSSGDPSGPYALIGTYLGGIRAHGGPIGGVGVYWGSQPRAHAELGNLGDWVGRLALGGACSVLYGFRSMPGI